MAPSRRRTTRKSGATAKTEKEASPVASGQEDEETLIDESKMEEEESKRRDTDSCPGCADDPEKRRAADVAAREVWIQCDKCKTWWHWSCLEVPADLSPDAIDKWFCSTCVGANPELRMTLKPPARKSSRKKAAPDYLNLHGGISALSVNGAVSENKWSRMLLNKPVKKDNFARMVGEDVTIEWVDGNPEAMVEPILIETPEGLGMEMPRSDLTVRDIADLLGRDNPVEVIDVASQSNTPNWTLGRWADYYHLEPSDRDKVRNVISLEISGTELGEQVVPPQLVRDLDWVDLHWPPSKKGKGHSYPKVQLYCLMSVANSYTDWHIDFAGSSVYYHIFRGSKVFYFIRPTPANLNAFEKWSGSELQTQKWLGDMVDEVIKVELTQGNTMIIPTGWIHAVYTPDDSLVFGGNFLHSYNVRTQLRVREIEINTSVPKKFRFPMFQRLCWYVAEKYLKDLKSKEELPSRVLEGVKAIADFLIREVHTIEKGTLEARKREARESVPSDRVKDAPALARELRWRVRLASGEDSGDEAPARNGKATPTAPSSPTKRKRPQAVRATTESDEDGRGTRPRFRNFVPRPWDVNAQSETTTALWTVQNAPSRPMDVDALQGTAGSWATSWPMPADAGEALANVESRTDVIAKVRLTADGLERERVERVVETWTWTEKAKSEDIEID